MAGEKRFREIVARTEYLRRDIVRKKERKAELEEAAASTGSFLYDQERVTGSSPIGSRQERLVMKYIELEKQIREEEEQLKHLEKKIRIVIGKLPERERKLMAARHIEHRSVEECMQRFGYSYETHRARYSRAVRRIEQMLEETAAPADQEWNQKGT